MTASTVGARIKEQRIALGLSQKELSKQSGIAQPTISALERDAAKKTKSIATVAHALHVNALWLQTGLGDPNTAAKGRVIQLATSISDTAGAGTSRALEFQIDVVASRGSCGGGGVGKRDIDEIVQALPPIIKDQAFFTSMGVEPSDVVAIVADGDAQANFIVHGDTVLICTARCDRLDSGVIYAIQTPRGLMLKRAIERADGHVILSCDNPDKDRYPSEEYTAEQAEKLIRIGRFLYRQG